MMDKSIANNLIQMYSKNAINSKDLAMFLAQIDHETQGFTRFEELGYSPARAFAVFPKKFKTVENAKKIYTEGGSDGLFNVMYGGRMGNHLPNDGAWFKGRGFFMYTGREMYTEIEKVTKAKVRKDPSIMVSGLAVNNAFALHYWKSRGLDKSGALGDVELNTLIVNGGNFGLLERIKLYNKWLKLIGDSK